MQCPNSDPEFNKIIGDRTPDERSWLFVACVLTRGALYTWVYLNREASWMRWVLMVISGLSIIQLSRPTENRQWWSKKFQLVMAILVFSAALVGADPMVAPVLLFVSLAGGVLQRLQTKLC